MILGYENNKTHPVSNKEIERKFIVDNIDFDLEQFSRECIDQSYISLDPEIRIRKSNDDYILTVKGDGDLERDENNIKMTEKGYLNLKRIVISNIIEKDRFLIPLENNLTAEFDIYKNKLAGLKIVEVEFTSIEVANSFVKPYWFKEEVTRDKRYKNKNLSLYEGDAKVLIKQYL